MLKQFNSKDFNHENIDDKNEREESIYNSFIRYLSLVFGLVC